MLEYIDQPGTVTTPHVLPDSVMCSLSSFRRRLIQGEVQREVKLQAGTVSWLPAQQHNGENIGETPTHAIFVELKGWTALTAERQLGRACDARLMRRPTNVMDPASIRRVKAPR